MKENRVLCNLATDNGKKHTKEDDLKDKIVLILFIYYTDGVNKRKRGRGRQFSNSYTR